MPTYVYKCSACNKTIEYTHPISEVDNPTEQTIKNTSCHYDRECIGNWQQQLGIELPGEDDLRFKRVPQLPNIQGSYGGSIPSGAEKRAVIQKERKERSRKDFKKNIYPTIPKQEQKHFDKKWKAQGKD